MMMREFLLAILSIILGIVCGSLATHMGAPDWGSFLAFLIGSSLMINHRE